MTKDERLSVYTPRDVLPVVTGVVSRLLWVTTVGQQPPQLAASVPCHQSALDDYVGR